MNTRTALHYLRLSLAGAAVVTAAAVTCLSWQPVDVERATTAAAPSRASVLIARHDCWTGAAPDPKLIPGHAVVTLPGSRTAYVGSAVGFHIWLDGKPGTLHAFCR